MGTSRAWVVLLPIALSGGLAFGCSSGPEPEMTASGDDALSSTRTRTTKESVGAILFADTNLSEPRGQACATCHDPAHAFTDARTGYSATSRTPSPTSQGAIAGRFGVRNSPSLNYASFVPPRSAAADEAGFAGGLFWDGRAGSLQEQAAGPLLNPIEMNNPDKATIQRKLQAAWYAPKLRTLYGATVLDDPDTAFDALTDAIATYEKNAIPRRFTSKYDAYLAGLVSLSAAEGRGLSLFEDPRTGPCAANNAPPCGCANCHVDKPSADGSPPLFTDHGYDNIGIPRNTANPFYALPPALNPGGVNFVDNALGAIIHNPRQFAHFRAPSLRNVAVTAPYGHNGYFADLASVVHFYNTRDVPGAWPAPESTFNMNTTGLGNLGLSTREESDLVAFMGTLTDGYWIRPSR